MELFLKALFVQDTGGVRRSHDWEKLFDLLLPGTQEALRLEYRRIRDKDPIVGDLMLLREVNPDAVRVRDFNRALKAARITFRPQAVCLRTAK